MKHTSRTNERTNESSYTNDRQRTRARIISLLSNAPEDLRITLLHTCTSDNLHTRVFIHLHGYIYIYYNILWSRAIKAE